MDYNFEDKKSTFIEALKESYTRQYKAVQPIPNRPEKLLSVEEVFVGGGVEQQETKESGTYWKRLESYHEIFRDGTRRTKRRVVEGEPGYGKSTLTLQAAYDWCNNVPDSPFSDVEILIILRLRQFCGVKSIFSAIKRLLVANEHILKVYDIERIITKCSSVHFILDGYDEYPDRQTNENNEVQNIIKGNMMKETEVTLLTRNIQDLENYLSPNHQRFKLTGFDDKAKDEYLHKTVEVQDSRVAADRVKRILRENYFLDDFCQLPLIFVILVHMVHEKADFKQTKTVTDIFRYIVYLFHYHLKNKTTDKNERKLRESYVNTHDELDKLALDGLIAGRVSWRKNNLIQRLGRGFYDQYVSAGILVEDLVIDDSVEGSYSQHEVTETRFYHKLLCEWYAANALVKEKDIRDVCERLDPFELQYLLRFASGINQTTSKSVTDALKMKSGTELFIILCLFESAGNEEELLESIRDLCTREVVFNSRLSRLGQRSMIQTLEMASRKNFPVAFLNMEATVESFDENGITLNSGLRLQRLSSVEQIRIYGHQESKIFSEEDLLNLFTFMQQSKLIQTLSLEGFVLPASINPKRLSFNFKSSGIKVYWTIRSIKFCLDLQSGLWEVKDKSKIQAQLQLESHNSGGFNRLYDVLCTIASYHDIPVKEYILNESRLTTDDTDTTRMRNLRQLATVERFKVDIPLRNRPLSNKQLTKIIEYATLSRRLEELHFQSSEVPIKLPDNLLHALRTSPCMPKVSWNPISMIDFRLNFVTGKWMVSDINELADSSGDGVCVSLSLNQSASHRWASCHLLEVASRCNIPVSYLSISDNIKYADGSKLVFNIGDPVKSSPVIERIHFTCHGMQYTAELLSGLLKYAEQSQRLQEMRFSFCTLPSSIPLHSIPSNLRERNFEVTRKLGLLECYMDLHSGHWEVKDNVALEKMCSKPIKVCPSDDTSKRRVLLQMMDIASRNNIHIASLRLVNVFSKVEDDMIILSSTDTSLRKKTETNQISAEILLGVQLPLMQTLKKLEIVSTTETEMSTNILPTLSRFVQQCKALDEIRITDVLFSGSISPIIVPSVPITWSLQVPFGARWDFRLNSELRRWEVEDVATLQKLCEFPIYLRGRDTKLIHASTIQIMNVACSYGIPVSCLVLVGSFKSIGENDIALTSGISVPKLPTLKKLEVLSEGNKTLSKGEFSEVLGCSQMFKQLKEICFKDKVLPLPVDHDTVKRVATGVKVYWSYYGYKLDAKNCIWEVDNGEVLRGLCSQTVLINKDEDKEVHECQRQLLIKASNIQIPVSILAFKESFSKSTVDSIILSSGSSLPHLSTVKEIELWMEQGHKIEEDELIAILEYGAKCKQLRHIKFFRCLLPYQTSDESILSILSMENRPIRVSWLSYQLDLKSGTWQNKETLANLSKEQYQKEVEVMQKRIGNLMNGLSSKRNDAWTML